MAMAQMQRLGAFGFVVAAAILSVGLQAQAGDPGTMAQEKLVGQFKLTKTTADRTDIVTAGDVVVLHKDGLMMCSTDSGYAYSNTYANGVLGPNMKNRAKDAFRGFGHGILTGGGADAAGAANNGCASRKFVAGEKFFVTDIKLQKDGILLTTYSDPYNEVRYYGEIKFPFQKGVPVPPVDAVVKTVQEVITVAPSDDKDQGNQNDQAAAGNQGGNQAPQQAAAPAPAPAPLTAIAPPPPPADAPAPTIALGQTKDQVVAGFGQPVRTAKLAGTKEIYFYKDMKVTFTNGKVSNVE